MCGAPDSKQPSHQQQQQQQQEAGTSGAAADAADGNKANGNDGAAVAAGMHQYVLLQRMANAATAESGHCHLHPVLGIEEVQLEEGQAATVDKGSKDEGQHPQQQQQQHSLSR
jgi:hypothetical protein